MSGVWRGGVYAAVPLPCEGRGRIDHWLMHYMEADLKISCVTEYFELACAQRPLLFFFFFKRWGNKKGLKWLSMD